MAAGQTAQATTFGSATLCHRAGKQASTLMPPRARDQGRAMLFVVTKHVVVAVHNL